MFPKFCVVVLLYVSNSSLLLTCATVIPTPVAPVLPTLPCGPVAPTLDKSNVVPSYVKLLPDNPITGLLVKSLNSPLVATLASELVLAFVAIWFVIVVLKLASSPSAAANSFNVSNVPGALSVIAATIVDCVAYP